MEQFLGCVEVFSEQVFNVEEVWVWYFLYYYFVVVVVEVLVVVEMFEGEQFVVEGYMGDQVVVVYYVEVFVFEFLFEVSCKVKVVDLRLIECVYGFDFVGDFCLFGVMQYGGIQYCQGVFEIVICDVQFCIGVVVQD